MSFGLFSACAAQPSPEETSKPVASQPPAYIFAAKGCAILVGGSVGSVFADPKISRFWATANEQISGLIYDNLIADKYKVVRLTVGENDDLQQVLVKAMARNKCSRILQLTHLVGDDANGKYVTYRVDALHVEPKKARLPGDTGTNVVTVGDYTKDYRYPFNPAFFVVFDFNIFAKAAYVDLKSSGVLKPLR